MSRLEFLDAGRAIAILGVIAVHTVGNFSTGINQLDFIISTGQFGVQLFFIISAYTMFHTLVERETVEKRYIVNFWIRRYCRIAVPFWAGIVVYQGFRFAHVEYFVSTNSDWYSIISSIFLFQGFWPTSASSIVPGGGSIAVEVIFYIVFPLIFLMRGSLTKVSLFGSLMILLDQFVVREAYLEAFSLLDMNLSQQEIHQFFYYYFFNQFPVFLFGIFAYIFLNRKVGSKLSVVEGFSMPIFILCFMYFSPKIFIISLIGFLLLLGLVKIHHFPRWLLLVGKHSYSLYLFHFSVINIMLIAIGGRPTQHGIEVFIAAFCIAVSGSILVSLIAKPLLEDSGSALGRLLVRNNENRKGNRLDQSQRNTSFFGRN